MSWLAQAAGDMFLWRLLDRGGYLMYPILACSVLTLAIFLERAWALRTSRVMVPGVLGRIRAAAREGKLNRLAGLEREMPGAMTNIALAVVRSAGKGAEEMRRALEDAGRQEVPRLERHLSWLATIANIAPLLGLLGTVTGIIRVFTVIAASGPGNPNTLAGGISEALLTTAAGLTVAIMAVVFHNLFCNRVDRLMLEMEKQSQQILEILSLHQGE